MTRTTIHWFLNIFVCYYYIQSWPIWIMYSLMIIDTALVNNNLARLDKATAELFLRFEKDTKLEIEELYNRVNTIGSGQATINQGLIKFTEGNAKRIDHIGTVILNTLENEDDNSN